MRILITTVFYPTGNLGAEDVGKKKNIVIMQVRCAVFRIPCLTGVYFSNIAESIFGIYS